MTAQPKTEFDGRFSDPAAGATPWSRTESALEQAELYWLTTIRIDGRPHVTPLVGLWLDRAFWFCTGPDEQKGRNLRSHPQVAVTTGDHRWAAGLDVVVEGAARRVVQERELQEAADAYRSKYGGAWDFAVGDGVFNPGSEAAWVFRVGPEKVLAFAKDPHAQTRYRFTAGGVLPGQTTP